MSINYYARQLISSRRLASIWIKLRESGHWHGTSHGFKMRIEILKARTIDGHEIGWAIRHPGGSWQKGTAESVTHGVRTMEEKAAEAMRGTAAL